MGFPVLGLNPSLSFQKVPCSEWCWEQEQCKAYPMAVLESPWKQARTACAMSSPPEGVVPVWKHH